MMISHKIKEGKPMTHIARDDCNYIIKKIQSGPFPHPARADGRSSHEMVCKRVRLR